MSIFYKAPDGEMKELILDVCTARTFLHAVQQSGFGAYKNEIAQTKKRVSNLPIETLIKMYIKLGKDFDSLYLELFVSEYHEKMKPLNVLLRYNYGSNLQVPEKYIDLYKESYIRSMLLAAQGKVLSDLLEKRLGKEACEKNIKIRKVREKASLLRNDLDMIMLGFCSG